MLLTQTVLLTTAIIMLTKTVFKLNIVSLELLTTWRLLQLQNKSRHSQLTQLNCEAVEKVGVTNLHFE